MGWAGLRRSLKALALPVLIVALGLPVLPGDGTAQAQNATFECPSAATPGGLPAAAASPAANDEPAARSVAFPARGGRLTVFAAASLTDAFDRIKADVEAANPGLRITYNFAGSQALVTQLEEGAEADVFASANMVQMKAAIDNGAIAGEPVVFARNRLAIVVPGDNPAAVQSPADLGKSGLRLVLAQSEVPVGRYARESVCAMAEDAAAYGQGFVERVAANVVSEEEDVRDVLAKVVLGEADAGIVYVSDAASAAGEVQLVEIPTGVNVIATYPIAAVAGGDAELAAAFIAYVLGPDGQAVLQEYGFELVA